ncbi:MAG TPA: prefoldin domain-containing protein [Steroidobacteraceae bacterium]|jgi:hypothetical protein|nr:prefoldin domain-containing protein [Steroidobacteraceae bacterium]
MNSSAEKYADAIAELQAQRAALEAQIVSVDTAISALKALQTGMPIPTGSPSAAPLPATPFGNGSGSGVQIELDTFHGLTTAQSIKKYLGMRSRKPATTQEIVEALAAGGQSGSDGPNFAVVVNNSLNRMSAADGEVSKVRKGIWGLKSWYSSKTSTD